MIQQGRRQRESSTLMILLQNILPNNKSTFFFNVSNSPHHDEPSFAQYKQGLCSDYETDLWDGFNTYTCGSQKSRNLPLSSPPPTPPRFHQLLGEVEVHFVIHVLALRIEPLQDLRQHVDSLLTAQTSTLSLELLQQVFGGHRFTDQVPPHCFLC